MRTDDGGGPAPRPTLLLDRWRAACLHALATADPHGARDRYLVSFIGEYFLAIHSRLDIIADPRMQERFCTDEAGRFLAVLACVPERRRQLAEAKAGELQRDGVLMFPDPVDTDDGP